MKAPAVDIFSLILDRPVEEVACYLKQDPTSANAIGEGGITPLMLAAYLKRDDVIAQLRLCDANEAATDELGADFYKYRLFADTGLTLLENTARANMNLLLCGTRGDGGPAL